MAAWSRNAPRGCLFGSERAKIALSRHDVHGRTGGRPKRRGPSRVVSPPPYPLNRRVTMSDVESDGEDEGGRPWAPWEDELLMSAVEPYRTANINVNWADVVGRLHEGGSRRTVSKARNREIRIKKGPGRNNCKICGQKRRGHTCTGRPGPPKTPKVAMNAAASSGSVALPSTSGASARAAARPTTPTHHAWNGHRANLRDDVPQSPPAPPGFGFSPSRRREV